MAWSIVGVSTPVVVQTTGHTLTEPAGVAAGDLLIATFSTRIASTTSMTLASGWTLVGQVNNNNTLTTASALPTATMAYIVRGASAPALTFTHPTAPSQSIGQIVAYRGNETSILAPLVPTSDARGAATSSSTYATVRSSTNATTVPGVTANTIGQGNFSGTYSSAQYFLTLNTSAIPVGQTTAHLSLNIANAITGTDVWEVREVSSTANMIAGDSLAALPLLGSRAMPTTIGRMTIPLDITSMSRSSATKLLIHSQEQRTATAAAANDSSPHISAMGAAADLQPAMIFIDGVTAVTTATAQTAVSVAGLTTTTADDLIVALAAGGQEAAWSAFNATTPAGASGATDTTTAPSATWRERADSLSTIGADGSLGIFDAVKTAAGATGNLTVTASVSAGHAVIAGAFKIYVPPPTADAWNYLDKSASMTLSNSDKTATSGAATQGVRATTKQTNGTAGKYYAEFKLDGSSLAANVGIIDASSTITGTPGAFCMSSGGNILINGGNPSTGAMDLGTPALNDVVCVAWDAGAERVWFRLNGGVWNTSGTADPATGTEGIDASFAAANPHALWMRATGSGQGATLRTELAEYTQAVPSGFTSWMGESAGGATGVTVNVTGQATTAAVGDVTISTPVSPFALVQSNEGTSTLATTTATLSTAPTAGNLIVLAFASDDYNGTPDSGWTQSTGMEQQSYHGGYIWWRISDGSNSFQYTISSATNSSWVVVEFSGVHATPYDISAGQFVNSAADTYTTPSITPTAGDRLLVAEISGSRTVDDVSGDLTTWLDSFTHIRSAGPVSYTGTADGIGVAYRRVSANGSTGYSTGATFPINYTPNNRVGQIIAFKAVPTTVNAVGQAVTAAVGDPSVTGKGRVILTGQAVTSAVGTLPLIVTHAYFTVAAPEMIAGTQGVGVEAGGSISTTAPGQAVTSAVGQVSVRADHKFSVTGQQVSGSVGDVSVTTKSNVNTVLAGQAATAGVGQVTIDARETISTTATGQEVAAAVGEVSVSTVSRIDVSVTPASQEITTAVGTPTITGKANVSTLLAGQAITTAVGEPTITANIGVSVLVADQELVSAVGVPTITTHARFGVDGQEVTSAVGQAGVTTGIGASVTVTGQAVTAAVGPPAAVNTQAKFDVTGQEVIASGRGVSVSAGGSVSTTLSSGLVTSDVGQVGVKAEHRFAITGTQADTAVGQITVDAKQTVSTTVAGQSLAVALGAVTVTAGTRTSVLLGGAAPVYRPHTLTSYAGRNDTDMDKPSGTVENDILIAALIRVGSAPGAADVVPPTGFTKIGTTTSVTDTGTFNGRLELFWKRATASEPATYTFAQWAAANTQGLMVAYSGCPTSGDPIDAFSQNAQGNPGMTNTAIGGGVTTTQAQDMLLWLGHNWTGSGTLTPPVSMTERADSLLYFAEETRPTAGATSNRGQTQAATAPWAVYMLALKGSSGAPALTGAVGTVNFALSIGATVPLVGYEMTADVGEILFPEGLDASVEVAGQSVQADVGEVTVTTVVLHGMDVWTGARWAGRPAKVWTGDAWVPQPVRVWNGSDWL